MVKKPKRRKIHKKPDRSGPIATNGVALARGTDDHFIREWRLFREIPTHGELADKCLSLNPHSGLSRVQISRLESGERPYRQDHLKVLAQVLGCTPGDLISTDPYNSGSIFTIYGRLTGPAKKKLDAYIAQLTK